MADLSVDEKDNLSVGKLAQKKVAWMVELLVDKLDTSRV